MIKKLRLKKAETKTLKDEPHVHALLGLLIITVAFIGTSLSAKAQCQPPAKPGSISGSTSVCYGAIGTYSVGAVSGAKSYKWTLPLGWSGASTTNVIVLTAGISGGSLGVAAVDSCGSSEKSTLQIAVNNIPARPTTVAGATSVCSGSAQLYTVLPVANATGYSWTLPFNWSGSSTTSSINVTCAVSGGAISVTANNACGSSSAKLVSVAMRYAPAQPAGVTGNTSVCGGTAQTFSVTPVNGAVSYTWTLPNGWFGYSASNKITVATGSLDGDIAVVANNACGSSDPATLTASVTAVPGQPGAIVGNTLSCSGSAEGYFIMPVAGATSYIWSLPAGWSGASTTNMISTTSGLPGTISVSAKNGCGTGAARTLSVTANNGPAQPVAISGTASVCNGSEQTYSINPVYGATSYIWTLPNGWSGASDSTSISTTAGATGGTISVQAINDCGTSTARDFVVSVTDAAPAEIASISGNTTVCPNTTQTYSVSPVSGATSYTWSLPSGWTGSSNSNSISVKAGTTAGTVSVTASNNCGSDTGMVLAVGVGGTPSIPGAITVSGGIANVCPGDTRTYVVPNTAGITYTWSVPVGGTIVSGQNTNSIVVAYSNGFTSSGMLSVKASNSCGTSGGRSISIARNIPAAPGVVKVNGTNKVCPGDSRTFSVTPVTGLSYTWTAPIGATITSGQGTNSVTMLFDTAFTVPGSVLVRASNNCASGSPSSIVVLRNTPNAPGSVYVTGGSPLVCPGDQRIYAVAAVAGMTYTWTTPSGATIAAGQGTSSVTVDFDSTYTAADYIKVAATNACATGVQTKMLMPRNTPSTPGSIAGKTSVCAGNTTTYSIPAVANATSYIWTAPAGASITSGQGTTRVNVLWSSGAGSLSVAATNGCGTSTSRMLTVNMNCRLAEIENENNDNATDVQTSVYPNPSTGDAKIQFSGNAGSDYKIQIMDLTGRETEVKNGIANEGLNVVELDLNQYNKGVYFIHLVSGKINNLTRLVLK